MTAQFSEILIMDGEHQRLLETPLEDYFRLSRTRPDFGLSCTALWRGYIGTWELIDGRLYLIGLSTEAGSGALVTLTVLFPGFPDRVFAHWYSGRLRVPQGEQIEYVHMGFSRQYERDLFIEIRRGCEIGRRIVDNTLKPDQESRV